MFRKICNKCECEKPLDLFVKNKKSKDNYRNECIVCYKIIQKEYRDNNKEKSKIYQKKYREDNVENLKEYYLIHNQKDYVKQQKNEWYLNNKDWIEKTEHRRKYRYEYNKKSIKAKWRSLLRNTLTRLDKTKEGKTIDLLGYSATELKEYLTSLFTDGMGWDNHGEWHIDHIKPLNSFNDDTPINEVNSLDNLQPLWATTREINGIVYEGNLNKGITYKLKL